jgi:RHS repeat-associated protein
LWIDGAQQADLTGVDNDTWRIDRARLGVVAGMDAGTSGTSYFDAFESRRSSYIGPMAQGGGYFVNYRFAPPLQSGSLTFTPLDDAYIESAVPTANYGTDTEVQVDNSPAKNFLLKFDVTGVNGQTVTNAKLCLYNTDGANAGGKFYSVTDNTWQEETVTWSNAPTADIQELATLGAVSPNTWYEVDFTSHITADGTYSLRVSNSTGGADYSSKEGTNDPKLFVAVAGATPQSCSSSATATPTNTPTPGPSPTPTKTPTPSATPVATNTPTPTAFSSAAFVYDGDGKRVKSTFNGTATTYFVGTHYEVANGVVTKYYYAGTQRIAMRTNGTLNFLIGDHLGSTSLTTSATGTVISELRYKAWGEERYASGATPTNYTYTGQYSYTDDFGLMFYNARWYDSSLGRFAQADTLIPSGVQGYDRYAYANNNPIIYTDPSGHTPWPLIIGAGLVLAGTYASLHLFGVLPDYRGIGYAKDNVTSKDPIVGAGIAVQSEWYGPHDTPIGAKVTEFFTGGTSNIGIAQSTHSEMAGKDPMNNVDAVAIMTERIHSAQNACNGCTSTDLLIIAAMAQNSDLNAKKVEAILKNPAYSSSDPTHRIEWNTYFEAEWQNPAPDPIARLRERVTGRQYNTRFMLGLYMKNFDKLLDSGWALPAGYESVNRQYIRGLQNRRR